MDKTIIGLVGAASALALANGAGPTSALAGPTPFAPAQSYAELLDPIPDAISQATTPEADAGGVLAPSVQLADYHHHYYHHHHYHHHHYHHHHYHHHHYHHHHHHHY